jgi:dipeptidyl aminopeptidase/acylaminoacyl peptidase
LIESVPREGNRPRLFSYRMPFSGDEHVPLAHLVVFDLDARRQITIQAEPLYVLHNSPIDFRFVWWSEDATKAYFVREERGAKQLTLFEVDPATGAARPMVEEASPTYAELYLDIYNKQPTVRVLGGGARVLWYSERDGWAHLYLYDGKNGALQRQLTRGEFVVRDVLHVDEPGAWVYFTAGGREPGRNPYFRHLYRIKLDGSGLALLTPENADHQITFTPSGKYFIDRFSRADTVPTFVLRSAAGKLVRSLETGDAGELAAAGWRYPEPFRAKARDGTTDVYGLIYRPSTFDPGKKYPVIDDIYPGPQTVRSAISFPGVAGLDMGWYWAAQSVAELGFIVVTVDGMGTPWRSKRFHDVSYRNLGDGGGLDDHVAAIRELAGRYPQLDTTRVGIYGASSGGYATLRAMLVRGDFYKVGVASVPYIGPSAIVAWWSDRYQGYPVDTANYRQSDLVPLAKNLRGKLMIALGGVDENADPFLVMPLLDAFVRADKDFDLVLLPAADHGGVGGSPYFIRKRRDYFVRHLLGVEPPNPNQPVASP